MIRSKIATMPSNKKKNHNKLQKLKKKKIKPPRNKKSNMRPKLFKNKLDQRSSMYLANMEWTQTFWKNAKKPRANF